MDEQKNPGITIEHVQLLNARIEMANPEGKRKYNLRLTGLKRLESKDGKTIDLYASFDVMHGVESPLFNFTCDFIARYVRQGDESMAWSSFSSAMALAHIIPYLREFISNITNRLPAPVLMIDPINTIAMIEDYEKRQTTS